jgi:hypothetical protein
MRMALICSDVSQANASAAQPKMKPATREEARSRNVSDFEEALFGNRCSSLSKPREDG